VTRHFTGKQLVVASHNAGKVRDIGELIAPYNVEAISAAALNLPEPEETETTFKGNAVLKARAAARASKMPALADDSGLCIDALNGDPGIYSARWAGPAKDFALAMRLVHEKLSAKSGATDRAHFVCALALAWPDDHAEVFQGEVYGQLTWPPRGTKGFGYDPIFIADGYDITFGEMEPAAKHAISHRARAFAKLIEACF
jgi:XTP/dITP diphosphohydrolase